MAVKNITRRDLEEVDRAALYALAALGDLSAEDELGQFGKTVSPDAIVRLKKLREFTALRLNQKAAP